MKFYPSGPVTRYGSTVLTERIHPLILYTSPDGTIQWCIHGGLAAYPGVQAGAYLADGIQGLHPPFSQVEHKGARQDGVTNQRTVFDPAEYDMTVEFTASPNHVQPELAASEIRRVIRDWFASWNPRKPGTLKWVTPDMGVWWCKPRLFKSPPDRQFKAQARRLRQRYTWTIRNDDAFWRGKDSISTFRFKYSLSRDLFNRDDVGTLGPQWLQTYTGAGAGFCETDNGTARWIPSGITERTVVNRLLGINEIQTVTLPGSPTGGDWPLTYSGQTTTPIVYNATAAAVQSALEALSNIGVGKVSVTGSAGGPYVVTFISTLGLQNVAQMTSTFVNEVQTVTITGSPTAGNFALAFNGSAPTTNIAFNATAAAVQSALEALSTIGVGNVAVTGGPGPATPYTVTFQGALAKQNVVQMTATHTFTGGTAPNIGVSTPTQGVGLTGGSSPIVTVATTIEGSGPNTATDNQVITLRLGEAHQYPFPVNGYIDIWGRHNGNDASPTAVRARIGATSIVLSRFNAGAEIVMVTQTLKTSPMWWEDWSLVCGSATTPRQFKILRNGFPAQDANGIPFLFKETGTGSALGASNRGTAWGMKAGTGATAQNVPPTVDEFNVGDNAIMTQSGHLTLTNFGDQDGYPRYLVYGPGTFKIANGPASTFMIEFGPLADNQIALLTTIPRLRGVVDLTPSQPAQPLAQDQNFLTRLISLATSGNVSALLDWFQSLLGISPAQGAMYSLLKGRFTNSIPAKPSGDPPTTASIAVEIKNGNADSKVIAALTPLRRWPE